jgi:hypothetical protein
VTGMFEGDYRAVLKALCADQLPTESRNPADDARTPSPYDVASLLEFGTPAVHTVAPRTPEPPTRWDARLRLMDFDLPGVSQRPAPTPEHE